MYSLKSKISLCEFEASEFRGIEQMRVSILTQ